MSNEHLQDAKFWESVEGDEVIELIQKLEAIPEQDRTKGERNKLAKAYIRLKQVRVEAERLAALNKKWQSGHTEKPLQKGHGSLDADLTAFIFSGDDTPERVKEPGKLYCSFCHDEVQNIHATRGTGQIRVSRAQDPVTYNGKVIAIEEHVMVQAEKVIACPNCIKHIAKPSVASRV